MASQVGKWPYSECNKVVVRRWDPLPRESGPIGPDYWWRLPIHSLRPQPLLYLPLKVIMSNQIPSRSRRMIGIFFIKWMILLIHNYHTAQTKQIKEESATLMTINSKTRLPFHVKNTMTNCANHCDATTRNLWSMLQEDCGDTTLDTTARDMGPHHQEWSNPQNQGVRHTALIGVHHKASKRYLEDMIY